MSINLPEVVEQVRQAFERLRLQCFPKTSGSKGLQVYVPLNTPVTYDETKDLAREMARLLERETPDQVVSDMKKALRVRKVFVDWSQNDRNKTTVSAYSLRARPRPTVSTPLRWIEVERAARTRRADALVFEARDVLARVDRHGDLFEPVLSLHQRLPAPDRLEEARVR